jgi:hypothetical protein
LNFNIAENNVSLTCLSGIKGFDTWLFRDDWRDSGENNVAGLQEQSINTIQVLNYKHAEKALSVNPEQDRI